jgi:hypothetical protein
MGFQIRKDARRWFKYLEKDYDLLFDPYYWCLTAGFASGRRDSVKSDEVDDFVEYFPGDYKSQGRLLVGLLIHAELRRLAIDLKERDAVYKVIKEIVDPESLSYMSLDGIKRMNAYAHGGFDVLSEELEERPRSMETFVRSYAKIVSKLYQDRSQK